MNNELINVRDTCILVSLLFAIAEAGYHFLKIKPEWTRKFVHLGTGLLALLFPVMLKSQWSRIATLFFFFYFTAIEFEI